MYINILAQCIGRGKSLASENSKVLWISLCTTPTAPSKLSPYLHTLITVSTRYANKHQEHTIANPLLNVAFSISLISVCSHPVLIFPHLTVLMK